MNYQKSFLFSCLFLVCLLFSANTMAGLILVDGGATGQWYNGDRDGEVIFVEIIEKSDGRSIGSIKAILPESRMY